MMKYMISVMLITMVLFSNSKGPLPVIVKIYEWHKTDTLVPKHIPDSFTLAGGKRISMIQVDSIIHRAAEKAMENARKRGYIDTTKQ